MQTLFKISIATIVGIIFLFGGAVVAQAVVPIAAPIAEFVRGSIAEDPSRVLTKSEQEALQNFARFEINCGWSFNPYSKENVMDCIPVTIYYLVYKPASYLLQGSAYIFDALFPLSLSKEVIQQPFIDDAWTIVRDVANMAFIFILLYVGISTMLGIGNWQKSVLHVVIIALFLNFSLFFTKVIIDAGNIFSVGIYNQLGEPSTTPHTNLENTGLPERGLSSSLATYFQPQKFMGAAQVGATAFDAIFVFLVAAVVSGYVAFVFLKVAFLLVGRLLMFWYYMIVSPIAFLTWALPDQSYFGKWFKGLVNQAFFPVVFLFFIYVIISIINAGIMDGMMGDGTTGNMVDIVIVVVLKTALIIIALQKSLKYAEKMADDAGGAAQKWGMKAMGFAGGIAGRTPLALGAKALRGTIGLAGTEIGKSGHFAKMATMQAKPDAGWRGKAFASVARAVGRGGEATATAAGKATFDARGISLVQKGVNLTGLNIDKAGGEGGYAGLRKKEKDAQEKQQTKRAERLKLTDKEKDSIFKKVGGATKEDIAQAQEAQEALTDIRIKAGKDLEGSAEEIETAKKLLGIAKEEYAKAVSKGDSADIAVKKTEFDASDKKVDEASKQHIALQDKIEVELKKLEKLEKKAADSSTERKESKKRYDNAINTENERRMKIEAQRIEGIGSQIIGNIISPFAYSHEAAKTAADKIRKAESAVGRKKTQDKEDTGKILKAILRAEKEATEETGERGSATSTKEKGGGDTDH